MPDFLYRKYIDLIRQVSSKYINWEPTVEFKVGTYGHLNKETGEFLPEGNVYDPEFKIELEKHRIRLKLEDYPPEEGPEEDLVISTRTAKRKDFPADKESQVPGTASFKGHWEFDRRDRRDAILVLHKARQIFFPPDIVLDELYKVDELIDKSLITNITVCSAYSFYLSEKSTVAGNTASLALVAKAPATGTPEDSADASSGLTWWTDTKGGLLRNGYDETGKSTFTPLIDVRRPIKRIRRFFRDKIRPEPEGDDLWCHESQPWDPLDEEGVEDPLDPEVRSVDPFATIKTVRAPNGAISVILE